MIRGRDRRPELLAQVQSSYRTPGFRIVPYARQYSLFKELLIEFIAQYAHASARVRMRGYAALLVT